MHTSIASRLLGLKSSATIAAALAAIPFAFAANPVPAVEDSPAVEMAPRIDAERDRDDGPRIAPPTARHEVLPRRPSQTHLWISGFWEWRRGHYVWTPGHWSLPPREHVTWVAPHWDWRGNRYVFIPGFWREEPYYGRPGHRPDDVVVGRPLPPPRRDYVPPRPSPRHVWAPGFWQVHGPNAVWVAGRWTMPVTRGYGWR